MVLVTGGAGYVGTHVLAALSARGHECVCVDNYSNSTPRALERLARLGGAPLVYEADVRDREKLERVLRRHAIDSVIHLAGLKAVGESVREPGRYRDNNVAGTKALLEALTALPACRFVFSSSATVYGAAGKPPIPETSPTSPSSPYAQNKLEIEGLLAEKAAARGWRVANLRYFNPVGAHPSGLIGEDPAGVPNNLMPYVCQVAAGRRERLLIFGNDYPTRDGTGVRDYIHVMDLAAGHLAALDTLAAAEPGTTLTLNLGTGRGHSVLEILGAFERVNGVEVARAFAPRREGDLAEYYADPSLARRTLGWEARLGLEDMVRDAWNWQRRNPDGYR